MRELSFMPRILLCGDEQEFFSQVGQRPFKIIGSVAVAGKSDKQNFSLKTDGKILFNNKLQDWQVVADFLRGGEVDYILFVEYKDFVMFRNYSLKQGFLSPKIVTIDHFKTLPTDFFYDFGAEVQLLNYLKNSGVKTLLDVDGYFSRGHIFSKAHGLDLEIDCICEKDLPPIMENMYSHVYKNFAEVGFKRYDAALVIERPSLDFIGMFTFLEDFSDSVITFARTDSELQKYILANLNVFEEVQGTNSETGKWLFITRHRKPEDFCVYVVTYKEKKLAEPPDGYKIIHAGRALSKDIGYLGDNTGDNISHLNIYLNEITALYWIWKNTSHTIVGLCHYRRFFTESLNKSFSYDKILTKDAAKKILARYDIIVSTIGFEMMIQHNLIKNDCGAELASFAEEIVRKHLLKVQPDYMESFEAVMDSLAIYKCHLFITRRNIFDAYCKWLFSFYLDATDEILHSVNLADMPFSPRRLIAFLAERMLTVWLRKNRLRIKELNFMFIEGI